MCALAALTVLLGVAVPFAPVMASESVLSWPREGRAPASTALPLNPPRPLSLEATVPCSALRAVGTGAVLRTVPAHVNPAGGLVVRADSGRVAVSADGRTALDEPIPATGDCAYRISAGADGLRVAPDAAPPIVLPDVAVPEVSALITDAEGRAAEAGLAVQVRTDDRYASQPSTLKLLLLVLHGISLAITLLLAARLWRGSGRGLRWPRPGWADALVAGVAASWVVLGPLQYDDAWYALMARNASEAGYIGNYVYMFNVTENPFVLGQYLMQFWGWLGGFSLWWLRLLPLLYGLFAWTMLRCLLAAVLGRTARSPWVPWALASAFLVWWLPYGMTLRPEPLIMCLGAAAMLLAEVARRRRSVAAAVAATVVAVLAVSCSPSGLVAWAPLVLGLPWLWRWMREQSALARAAAVLTLAAAGTALVPVGFADASFGDVVEATKVHRWYYASFSWYEEWRHLSTLMAAPWALRLPLLLTLGVGLLVALGRGRRCAPGTIWWLTLTSAVITALALALLALSPTKWVLHFGAASAPAIVLLAMALLRSPLPRGTGVVAGITGTGVLIALAVAGFAGPNSWKPYSDRGQPFGNHVDPAPSKVELEQLAPHIGDVFLRDIALWIGLAALIAGIGLWRRKNHRGVLLRPERGVLAAASMILVVGVVAVFVHAPVRQWPGWTVASGGLHAVRDGRTAGLADHVRVLDDAAAPLAPPTGEPHLTGDFADASAHPSPVPPPGPGPVWHTSTPEAAGTGTLSTGWYPVPPSGDGTHITVPVLGDDVAAHRLLVQAETPRGVVDLPLEPDPALGSSHWQELAVALPDRDIRAVRVVAEQRAAAWMAVGGPRLTDWRPVTSVTDGEQVFADQLSAPLWPNVDHAEISNGMVRPAGVRLLAAENIDPGVLNNHSFRAWGGTRGSIGHAATFVRMTADLPGGPPTAPWGSVERVVYEHPPAQVDLTEQHRARSGWERLPTLAGESYIGRPFTG
ncbi:arabinosyltransferase domain-containing protein [Saccharopolyspora griseoalba]|uniref:Arabinosyltransferase domain-containing protein n=1 Tax=Saccharopolyspora griseoalba TaxID=1431848 RepID=A0ABW2LIG0_9PSEU